MFVRYVKKNIVIIQNGNQNVKIYVKSAMNFKTKEEVVALIEYEGFYEKSR